MPLERGQRVIIHRRGQLEDGWYGWVDAVSPDDVVVQLDRSTQHGRLISFRPREVFPVANPKP